MYIDGTKLSYLHCPKEVPQGSILGPILFSLYINDELGVCKNVNLQMYADDVVIFTHVNNCYVRKHRLPRLLLWHMFSIGLPNQVHYWTQKNCLRDVCKTNRRDDTFKCIPERGEALNWSRVTILIQYSTYHTFKNHCRKWLMTNESCNHFTSKLLWGILFSMWLCNACIFEYMFLCVFLGLWM